MSPNLLAYLMLEGSMDILAGPAGIITPENEARADAILNAIDRLWWGKMTSQDRIACYPESAEWETI